MLRKHAQPFDFMKLNKIQKLVDEVKYKSNQVISQTSTMQQWTPGIKIDNSNKSKANNYAN